MNTSPAIVAQSAVRRLPRWLLIFLCASYILSGFIGRAPWKNADIATFGYMLELANGYSNWSEPILGGFSSSADGILAPILGAASILIAKSLIGAQYAARLPFIAMLIVTFIATWYAVYNLARHPKAQPVAFAFGGEANPKDYARALADGALLALIACLGLAQLSHETTSDLLQLCCVSLCFYAVASSAYHRLSSMLTFLLGLCGLALSGAPNVALFLGATCAFLLITHLDQERVPRDQQKFMAVWMILVTLFAAYWVWFFDLQQWRLAFPTRWIHWRNLGRMLIWFAWPAWFLALWAVWRWRQHLKILNSPLHLALPLWFVSISLVLMVCTQPAADRALLLSLPALAALAAFALPTLSRNMAALIDWFTMLFFSTAALVIWVIWLSLQIGIPKQPALNIARLAPGFEASFSWMAFVLALIATLSWFLLVHWRVGKYPKAIWKSLVLPAGGTALAWVLLMTLCLPLLDYARSYAPMVGLARELMGERVVCAQFAGLSRAQIAAFQYHGQMRLYPYVELTSWIDFNYLSNQKNPNETINTLINSSNVNNFYNINQHHLNLRHKNDKHHQNKNNFQHTQPRCEWLLIEPTYLSVWQNWPSSADWQFKARIRRPSDKSEDLLIWKRMDHIDSDFKIHP